MNQNLNVHAYTFNSHIMNVQQWLNFVQAELEGKNSEVTQLTEDVKINANLCKEAERKYFEVEGEYNKLKEHSLKVQVSSFVYIIMLRWWMGGNSYACNSIFKVMSIALYV